MIGCVTIGSLLPVHGLLKAWQLNYNTMMTPKAEIIFIHLYVVSFIRTSLCPVSVGLRMAYRWRRFFRILMCHAVNRNSAVACQGFYSF